MSNAPSSPPPGLPATAAAAAPPVADLLGDRRRRVDGWTPAKVATFIDALGESGSVTKAAAAVGMTTASCYALKNRPGGEPFAAAWDSAIAVRHEMLTDIAMERVRDGVQTVRLWRGQPVFVDQVFSDRLLIHMLTLTDPARRRANRPGAATATEAVAALPAADAAADGGDE